MPAESGPVRSGPDPAILRGVDLAAFAVALATRLRAAGVPVGLTAMADFVGALAAVAPGSRSELYWTARVSMVRRHGEIAVFDAVFAAVFADAVIALDPHARRSAPERASGPDGTFVPVPARSGDDLAGAGLPWVTLPPAVAGEDDSDSALVVPWRLPSGTEGLADTPFAQLSPSEIAVLGRWLAAAVRTWPTRRSRRFAVDRSGHRVAVRPTIARSRRTGWEPIELVRVRPVAKPRRVVMLCDVSGSMQAQTAAYLHLMRALALTADAEIFAFATGLTRLTSVLAHRSAEVAIEQATAKVGDRFGGTRIASNLRALLASHHGGALRGAIVLVASDGWDSDSPDDLAAAMARVRRRAHRVIWMNPRLSAPGFEPRVATMAAALPYCDDLLPAHTFAALADVISAIARSADRPGLSSTASRGSAAGTGRR